MGKQSQDRIQRLLAKFDADPRIPSAFTEEQLIDLALVVFETVNAIDPELPVEIALGVALRKYIVEKASTP